MIIHCPFCGKRYSAEFSYEGDASVQRPVSVDYDDDIALNDAWHNYVYLRKNGIQQHQELWQHISGCRQFIVVTRDLKSHEISKVQTLDEFRQNDLTINSEQDNAGSRGEYAE